MDIHSVLCRNPFPRQHTTGASEGSFFTCLLNNTTRCFSAFITALRPGFTALPFVLYSSHVASHRGANNNTNWEQESSLLCKHTSILSSMLYARPAFPWFECFIWSDIEVNRGNYCSLHNNSTNYKSKWYAWRFDQRTRTQAAVFRL